MPSCATLSGSRPVDALVELLSPDRFAGAGPAQTGLAKQPPGCRSKPAVRSSLPSVALLRRRAKQLRQDPRFEVGLRAYPLEPHRLLMIGPLAVDVLAGRGREFD